MAKERLYIVAYDISDPKRWRKVFKSVKGYGEWVQLSVFQCRLTARRHAQMVGRLTELIDPKEDHVLIFDLGLADKVELFVESIGKEYNKPVREAVIV